MPPLDAPTLFHIPVDTRSLQQPSTGVSAIVIGTQAPSSTNLSLLKGGKYD